MKQYVIRRYNAETGRKAGGLYTSEKWNGILEYLKDEHDVYGVTDVYNYKIFRMTEEEIAAEIAEELAADCSKDRPATEAWERAGRWISTTD